MSTTDPTHMPPEVAAEHAAAKAEAEAAAGLMWARLAELREQVEQARARQAGRPDADTPITPEPTVVRCLCGERVAHATADGYGHDGCDDPDPDGQIERLNEAVAEAERRAEAAEDRAVTAGAERQWADTPTTSAETLPCPARAALVVHCDRGHGHDGHHQDGDTGYGWHGDQHPDMEHLRRWATDIVERYGRLSDAGEPAQPAEPTTEPLDLDAIEREWLVQCGPCDFGLVSMPCQCPPGDHRNIIQRLCAAARQLRALVDHQEHNLGASHTNPPNFARATDPEPAQPLDDATLAAIEARASAATPGPWHEQHIGTDTCVSMGDYGWVASGVRSPEYDMDSEQGRDDAEFIAHARVDIPALLAAVRRARGELDDLRGAVAPRGAIGAELDRLRARVAELEQPLTTWKLPPEHAPGTDPDWCGCLVSEAAELLREQGRTALAEHVETLERWHARGNPEHLYGVGAQPNPWATWNPAKATDEPDGLPDRAIVPLVEELRARGIVTLQSCAGHLGSDDGTLWVRADSVHPASVGALVGEPFDRVQLVHWPECRWEFIWRPERSGWALAELRQLRATLPAGPAPECDECGGSGVVEDAGTWGDATRTCRACKGSGRATPPAETGGDHG